VVGGAIDANRLSGNAITEALVFGCRAGRSAAARVKQIARRDLPAKSTRAALDLIGGNGAGGPAPGDLNTAAMIERLQAIMADDVGPFRIGAKLKRALEGIDALTADLSERPPGVLSFRANGNAFDLQRLEWFDLRNMLTVARAVAQAALSRDESRGAHQREDCPQARPQWRQHQRVRLAGDALQITGAPAESRVDCAVMSDVATLKIRRTSAGTAARWETFEVPFEPGQSVLDGLRWLRSHKDPSLAIRFSCINANACKECMIQLDGETVYACTARLEPREMTLTPLPNKKLVRDLVTEIAPPSERFK